MEKFEQVEEGVLFSGTHNCPNCSKTRGSFPNTACECGYEPKTLREQLEEYRKCQGLNCLNSR